MAYRNTRWSNAYVKAGQDNSRTDTYGVTAEEIRLDLTHINHDGNRPLWPLSSYAPGKNAPRQLIEGPLEISPEEMRVQCYLARANGKGDDYINQENQLINQSQQQAQTILNDLEAAKNYVIDGVNHHPNRHDMEIKPTQNFPWVNKPSLPQQSQSQASPFGQPSAFGGGNTNTPTGFGQPSSLGASKPGFGAPSNMGSGSGFGQSSTLGSGTAFGQTSQMGGSGGFGQASKLGGGGTAFGQASTPASNTPFGGAQKPTAFGQAQSSTPAFGQSGFGSGAKPGFGAPTQPTAFGQPAQAPTPFGQPAQQSQALTPFGQAAQATPPTQPTAFGQPSQPSQPSAFGGGQTGGTAFGQPSAFGAAKPSPFAVAAQQQSQPQTGGTAFGQPSSFGSSKPNPFGAAQPANSTPFAASNKPPGASPFATAAQNSASATGFGAPSQPTGGFGTQPNNTTGGFGTAAPAQPGHKTIPQTWNGHRVLQEGTLTYYEIPAPNPKDRHATKKVRIWFPTGPPEAKDASYAEAASPDVYEGQLGQSLKELYEYVATNLAFKDGVMPEVPPKREWINWEF
ncbi:hypothetical protein PRZ48_011932 [Zasmidium cellare]|uniref:Uncharacterized protein n=1 Tax=Zasmidium cellare TaxID=395010 RepID=A0ABR0E8C8_ZASCE|nr:hypothetical protein PRZ48_011932 [Zasmidium cellare]